MVGLKVQPPPLHMAGALQTRCSLQARAVRRGDVENQIDDSLDYDNPHVKASSRRSLTLAAVATVRPISPFI